MQVSETSRCKSRLATFCKGAGLDIGFGGDPITPNAITIDLPTPYCIVGNSPQHLAGDARQLHWFKDSVLDYVYSSHLLEDFTKDELPQVLKEWFRILKTGGTLIIYSPNQTLYLSHCKKNKQPPNPSHKIPEFGLTFVLNIFKDQFKNRYYTLHAIEPVDDYSFEAVIKKTG